MITGEGCLLPYTSYGSVGQRIYDLCCDEFGWDSGQRDEFARQRIMYAYRATREGYSVWFLVHHTWIEKKEDATAKWWNTIGKDAVYEEWYNSRISDEDRFNLYNDRSPRLTFARNRAGQYTFIGIFKPQEEIREFFDPRVGERIFLKTYQLVGKRYG